MSIGPDPLQSGQSQIYTKQQPEGQTFNGNTVITEMVLDADSLVSHYGQESYGGQVEAAGVSFTIAQGASTGQCVITIQLTDGGGNPISNQPVDLDVYLSDSAFGIGLTATAPVTSATITTGTVLQTYTANKAYYAQCNASGQIVLTITSSAKNAYYIAVAGLPVAIVSRQLTTADYHP